MSHFVLCWLHTIQTLLVYDLRLQSRQYHISCWKIKKLACLSRWFVSIPDLGVGGGDAGGDSCEVCCVFSEEFVGDIVDNSWQESV